MLHMPQKEQEQGLSEMPIVVTSSTRRDSGQGFSNLRDALAYIAADQRHLWHIRTSLEVGIKGRLTSRGNREYVHLTLGRRKCDVPRFTSAYPDGIRVSTDGSTVFDVFIRVTELKDRVFDRGLSWIRFSNPQKAYFDSIILRNHGLSANELVQRYIQVQRTAMHYINNLLNGHPSPPELA